MTDTWNTRAIVLTYRPLREADRLYTVYTEQFGKQVLRAQAVRKPSSKLAGSLEPYAEIDLYQISARAFNRIGGAVVRHRFGGITSTPDKLQAAWFITRLIAEHTHEDSPDPQLYALLYSTLVWLEHNVAQRTMLYSFAVKCIRALGFDPTAHAPSAETKKVIQWLVDQPYTAVQKLRCTAPQWQALLSALQSWLDEHRVPNKVSHVQVETFLV